MKEKITSRNSYDAENYDEEESHNIRCVCGHVREWHEWDDFEGERCTYSVKQGYEECECTKFKALIKDNKVVYGDEKE